MVYLMQVLQHHRSPSFATPSPPAFLPPPLPPLSYPSPNLPSCLHGQHTAKELTNFFGARHHVYRVWMPSDEALKQ